MLSVNGKKLHIYGAVVISINSCDSSSYVASWLAWWQLRSTAQPLGNLAVGQAVVLMLAKS